MNTIKEIQNINELELERGIAGTSASWHSKYSKAPWVYVGNLDHSLTEGDVLAVLSQFGEIEDIHLVREEDTGKSKGFGFVKYEDARSGILAVDNLIGIQLCGRSLRIDHVENYRLPKHLAEKEEESSKDLSRPGYAYQGQELANEYSMEKGQDLFAPAESIRDSKEDEKAAKQARKERRQHKREKKAAREAKRARKEERQRRRDERRKRHDSDDDKEDRDRYSKKSRHDD